MSSCRSLVLNFEETFTAQRSGGKDISNSGKIQDQSMKGKGMKRSSMMCAGTFTGLNLLEP